MAQRFNTGNILKLRTCQRENSEQYFLDYQLKPEQIPSLQEIKGYYL
ncbi:MAG: hypothetical protein RLZZ419_247 [Pseudomonadota bacterium]|jgi:hypothetical protein